MRNTSQTVLTKRTVDGCAPSDKRYDVWDSQVPGFGLRVGTSGVKTFVVRYRADGGGRSAPRRYVTVGRYGAVTVEQARKKAQQILAEATVGDDPAMKRNGLVTVSCRSPISLCDLGLECERADAAQI